MGILRRLFGVGPVTRDVAYYATQLSKQMYKISKLGVRLESYFPRAYQSCPNRAFIDDALRAFKSVGGEPGDAALEIYRDLDKDIDTVGTLLVEWRGVPGVDGKLLSYADDLHTNLEQLRAFIADTPPDMMEGCIEIVKQKRARK